MTDPALVDQFHLVAAAAAGDRAAFHGLYRQLAPTVAAFVARRVPAADADDVVAETFVAAWRALPRFEWRGVPLRAWLLRIAFHQVVARNRRAARREVALGDLDPGDTGFADVLIDRLVNHQRVSAALAELTVEQRRVVELRYLDGLDVQETAAVLGIAPEAVRARVHRGLLAMRHVLAGDLSTNRRDGG